MSKRGDKRRARKKRRRARAKPDSFPTLEIGPLTIQNQGLNIVSVLDPDHPDYAQYVEWRSAMRSKLPELINDAVSRLEEMLAPLSAFDALAYYQLLEMTVKPGGDPDGLDSSTSLLAGMETIGAIVARRPNGAATAAPERLADTSPVAIQDEMRNLLTLEVWAALDRAERADPADDLATLRSEAAAVRVSVRGPSYPWQERETLSTLFGSEAVARDLRETVGATVDECLKIEAATEVIGTQRLERRMEATHDAADRLLRAVEARRRGQKIRDPNTRILADELAALKGSAAEEEVRRWATALAGAHPGHTLSFTTSELAQQAEVDEGVASALLGLLSTPFGAKGDIARVREEFRTRPLLRDDDRFFCVSHHQMLWGLRPVLEQALNENGAFQTYERHRAHLSEERSLTALTNALGPDVVVGPFEYSVDGAEWIESDGLLVIDEAAILLEVKASSMRASVRRAAPASWRDWLEDEIGAAAQQARRARDALKSPSVQLRDGNGHRIDLDLSAIRRWFEVIVTLEDLPTISPATWQLAEAGILPKDPIPWIVGLHELEVLVDLIEWPAQFVHYLLRRRRMDDQRTTWAIEELDLFIYYLERGLFWETGPEQLGPPRLVAPATDRLDRYLYYRNGLLPKKAKRPRMRMHRSVRALLDSLDRLDVAGRLEPQLLLLDIDSAAAERIATACGQLKRDAERRRGMRDMTLFFQDAGVGVTVMACPAQQRGELQDVLANYCTLKRHQAKYDRWIGFGCFAGPPEPAQLVFVLDSPWEPDAELDKLAATLPTAQSGPPPPRTPGRVQWWRDGSWRTD